MATKDVYELPFGPSSEAEGGASVPFARFCGEEDFESGFRWVDFCIIKPGAEISIHGHDVDDEVYFIFDGSGIMTVNGEESRVGPGDLILLRAGGTHGLANDSDEEIHVFVVDLLAPSGFGDRSLIRNVREAPMVTKRAHGGEGEVRVGQIFTDEEIGQAWDFIEVVEVPPESSIGEHEHADSEELYFIVEGSGRLRDGDQSIEVGPGFVSLLRQGGTHGLESTSQETVRLVVLQAPVPANRVG